MVTLVLTIASTIGALLEWRSMECSSLESSPGCVLRGPEAPRPRVIDEARGARSLVVLANGDLALGGTATDLDVRLADLSMLIGVTGAVRLCDLCMLLGDDGARTKFGAECPNGDCVRALALGSLSKNCLV